MPTTSRVSCPPCPECHAVETEHLPLTDEISGEALCRCFVCGHVWRTMVPPQTATIV